MDTRSMFYGAPPSVFEKARWLRRNETEAEKVLWKKLSGNQLLGLRFKRQHPISNFIADFYCHQYKLVIEIDEQYHDRVNQKRSDANRDALMIELGIKVLRFPDKKVVNELDVVLDEIKKQIAGFR